MFRLSRLPFIRKITAVMLTAFCLLVPPEAGLCKIVRDVQQKLVIRIVENLALNNNHVTIYPHGY